MKTALCFVSLMLCLAWQLAGEVVINEVCYDPEGSDDNKEWIELYNNGSGNEQLQGALIMGAGSTFTMQFTLPAFILRPGRYLLIGESMVPNCQLTAELNFQNATDGTDGVRYLSPSGTYKDTVLYGSPNINHLSDDTGYTGTLFAPDVPDGYSLSRKTDGVDTNDPAADFITEANPTPGLPNRLHCDYALGTPVLQQNEDFMHLDIYIRNLSDLAPTAYANFTINQAQNVLWESQLAPIAAGDSVLCSASFTWEEGALELRLSLLDDPDSTNNFLSVMPQGAQPQDIVINEFMADPQSGGQEWIELFIGETALSRINGRGEYGIRDISGNMIRFYLTANPGYYVICADSAAMHLAWPDCPSHAIIQAATWANLNNDGDSLCLLDQSVALDSLAYNEAEIIKGISRERYLDEENAVHWRHSYAPEGATPGLDNSLPPQQELPPVGHISLSGSPFSPRLGERLAIAYNLKATANRISCHIFDLRGEKICTLADYTLSGESGVLYWDGKKQNGCYAPRGLYIVLWESQATSGGKILNKQLTAVLKN